MTSAETLTKTSKDRLDEINRFVGIFACSFVLGIDPTNPQPPAFTHEIEEEITEKIFQRNEEDISLLSNHNVAAGFDLMKSFIAGCAVRFLGQGPDMPRSIIINTIKIGDREELAVHFEKDTRALELVVAAANKFYAFLDSLPTNSPLSEPHKVHLKAGVAIAEKFYWDAVVLYCEHCLEELDELSSKLHKD